MHYKYYEYYKLKELVGLIFRKYGYSEEDSNIISDVILTADLFGIESHGVQRLSLYPYGIKIGRIIVNVEPTIVKETVLSTVYDANKSMGQIVGKKAMDNAIDKAKQHGFGISVVRNSNHYGISGYYSLMAAYENLIGMSMTNTQALVVPTYGKNPMLGTNPIAFSVPSKPVPFHLDFSTSVVTGGKMEVYAKNNEPLPDGWAVDENGKVNKDAQVFVNNRGKNLGGLLPLGGEGILYGGHKGYGLSIIVEFLTGIISGGVPSIGVRSKVEEEKCSHVFIAINPTLFNDEPEKIFQKFSSYLNKLRSSDKALNKERIYTHGEMEFISKQKILKEGVGINIVTLEEILTLCQALEIDSSDYLVEKGR